MTKIGVGIIGTGSIAKSISKLELSTKLEIRSTKKVRRGN